MSDLTQTQRDELRARAENSVTFGVSSYEIVALLDERDRLAAKLKRIDDEEEQVTQFMLKERMELDALRTAAGRAQAELIEANMIMDYGEPADFRICNALTALAVALGGDPQ